MPAPATNSDSFAILEQRIAALTSTLESRERPAASESTEHLESALRALSDRIDRMPVGNDNASAFAHLEQRVSYLLERLEASTDHRASGDLGRVEDGLQDILRHLENQNATFAALAQSNRGTAEPADSGLIDIVKRELTDIRFSQTETDRHTQDSLEAVHNTLGHVVDRLAMIEGDLRTVRTAPVAPQRRKHRRARNPLRRRLPRRRIATPPQPKPELPNPAAAQEHFAAAPREFQAAPPPMPAAADGGAARHQRNSGAVCGAATAGDRAGSAARSPARTGNTADRPSGFAVGTHCGFGKRHQRDSGWQRARRPAHRVSLPPRAAPPRPPRPRHLPTAKAAAARSRAAGDKAKEPSTITSKIRSLLVGASVVVIVLGTFKMAMTLLDGGSTPPPMPAMETFERATAFGSTARAGQRQAGNAGSGDAFDDLADADRPAIAQQLRADGFR